MNQDATASNSDILQKYILSAIGIGIMIFFGQLPAPEPITPAGMTVIGLFIGLVILWTLVDLIWPTFVALVLFGPIAKDIYPGSFQRAGIYEAGMQSFGSWIVLFVLGCLILTVALYKSGSINRIAYWFITRKTAKRGIWRFTYMFLLATLVIGCFTDALPVQIFMLGIAYEVFDDLGYKKGDMWPKVMVTGITFCAIISFVMTPISHPLPLLFIGIMEGIAGVKANLFLYMLVGVPIGLILFIALCIYFRSFVKLSDEEIAKFDVAKVEAKKPGPMDLREFATNLICALTLTAWVIPGVLSLIASGSDLAQLFGKVGLLNPLYIAIAALAIIYVGGRPLLSLREAFADVEWTPVVFLASVIMVAGCMGEPTTGIPQYMDANIAPMLNGLGPYALLVTIAVLCCLITNVANNVAVGIIFVVMSTPLALEAGLNPVLIGIAVALGANLAFTIPPSFVPIGVAYASPWGDGGVVFKHGVVMTAVTCIVLAIFLYPLGSLVFGAGG